MEEGTEGRRREEKEEVGMEIMDSLWQDTDQKNYYLL